MTKNITPHNDKKQKHGYWEVYKSNGSIAYKGFYINNIETGYEEYTYYDGTYEISYHL